MKGAANRLVFFGTPAFAVPSLRALHEAGLDLAAVVTAPDKPAGRGLRPQACEVKQYALQHGLPVLQPERLRDEGFLSEIRRLNPRLQVVVAFRMMPEALWSLPPLGTINLHASLLPQYRGAAPIQRAVMNGETETGLTTFFLKHEVDTGNILFREETAIGPEETAGELHDRLMHLGAALLLKTVQAVLAGEAKETPQDTLSAGRPLKTAPRIHKTDCRIDWNRPVREVYNQIRGLSPSPGAFTVLRGAAEKEFQVKILRARPGEPAGAVPGRLRTDSKSFLAVACADAWLEISEWQWPGKRRMTVPELLRGSPVDASWRTA
jgi:methionyl-tRNA formyltransferase